MKRIGKHPQGSPRLTCLADKVHRFNRLDYAAEFVRKILKTHHGDWGPSMSLEEFLVVLDSL